jgi:hypothetical protein
MRLEVNLAATSVGHVRVALGRPEVGVAEHLLNRSEVGAAFEQMRRERVAEEVGMNASRLEPSSTGKLPQDEEGPGARKRPAADVQEELGPVTTIQVRPAEREVPSNRLCCRAPERYEALLVSLSEHADDPLLERDATLLESDRLGHAQSGSVEKFDERPVAQRSRARAGGRVDEVLGLGRRKRARERARPPR